MHAAARIQPAAILETTLEPSVTYDAKNQQIHATVIVSLPQGAGDLVYQTPLIGVPGPGDLGNAWTVFWKVLPGEGLTSVTFEAGDGIVVPASGTSLPPNVHASDSQMGSSLDEWQITIANTVTGTNSFNYDITCVGIPSGPSAEVGLKRFTTTTHDPTIVVTKDPIG